MKAFTLKQFNEAYKTDEACLEEIYQARYGNLEICPKCEKKTNFYKVTDRKCYACQWCGFQLHPLAGTIFHKSETSLKMWFHAIWLFGSSKNGVSAMELMRQTGVTYKTAWRMARQIRLLLAENDSQGPLTGIVEADETLMGGRGKKEDKKNKAVVLGMVERQGRLVAKVVPDYKKESLIPQIKNAIEPGSTVVTDLMSSYQGVSAQGYVHQTINHVKDGYVKGSIYTNTIEGFWGQLKRSINGTYHSVSKKHLQLYVSEFAWRYSNRKSETPLFLLMIALAAKP